MRTWWESGGSDSCCKDGNFGCCMISVFKCVLGGVGHGVSSGGRILAVVVVVIGYWWWW